jgi:hypothetical protein
MRSVSPQAAVSDSSTDWMIKDTTDRSLLVQTRKPLPPEKISAQPEPANPIPVLNTPGVPDRKMILQILWTTLVVIDEATRQGEFDEFMKIVSPRLKSELKPEDLPKQFSSLNTDRIRVGNAVGSEPRFEFVPHIIEDGRLRMRGKFNVMPTSIKFDLLYAKSNGIWYLDAIAFAEGGSA